MSSYCPSCLKEQKNGKFCPKCSSELFDKKLKKEVLDFDKEEFIVRYESENSGKFSISGMQDKILLSIDEKGSLEASKEISHYILKPIPSDMRLQKRDDVPSNEHLSMQIARQAYGLSVASCGIIRFRDGEAAYITRRFDRDGAGIKKPKEDFCQAMGLSEANGGKNYKYDKSYEEVALFVSALPAGKILAEEFIERLAFNYLIANEDAHLKNFAFLRDDGILRLSPCYDLLFTRLHIPSMSPTANDMFYDGKSTPSFDTLGFFTMEDFLELGRIVGLNEARLRKKLARFADVSKARILLERSFLSDESKGMYERQLGDRCRVFA
jgi:serine/threonine-protein kinase HipA